MPIVRSYMCADCGYHTTVTIPADQWDTPAPNCPRCIADMRQDFKPVAIGGSPRSKAEKLKEDILDKDYNVGNLRGGTKEGDVPSVRYKDQGSAPASKWGVTSDALAQAVSSGRQVRLQHGSGLDVLQQNLKSGAQPDLIELSKRRSIKVW